MFERLKFKKKTDAASPFPVVLPGPKAEATPEESAAFSVPPFHPSSLTATQVPVSTSSIPSSLAYYTCNNSNNDSGYGLGRSTSSGSAHLRQKASLTSLNNNYSNAGLDIPMLSNMDGIGYSFTKMSMARSSAQDLAEVNYKVPVQVVDDSIGPGKFHASDTYSQTSTNYSQHASSTNATMTPLPTPALAIDSDRRSSQGPKINPATKPSAGSFVGAIVTSATPVVSSTIEFVSSSNNSSSSSSSNNTITANNMSNSGVPASSTSSATPSRSSSTSNRGGTGMSPTGSFTPLSATPPMTPRMAHGEAATNGQQDSHVSTVIPPQPSSQSHIPNQHHMASPVATTVSPVMFSAAALVSSTAVATLGQYQHPQQQHQYQVPIVYGSVAPPSSETEEDGVTVSTITFVSSPIHQPPSNSLSASAFSIFQSQQQPDQQLQQPQPQPIQYQCMPPIAEGRSASISGTTAGIGSDGLSRSKSRSAQGNGGKDALLQQQLYQDQQMAQFREELDRNNSWETTIRPNSSASGAAEPVQHDHAPPPFSGVSIIATMVSEPLDPPIHQSQVHGSSKVQDEAPVHGTDYQRTGVKPESSDYSQHGVTVNGGAGGHGPGHVAMGSLGNGGSTFFPMPITRASTALAMSHLITHDVRQKTEQSHIIDGAGPMMLMAIGKTGQGKSSLLNKIMGTSELKASASVRAVTKGIAERTGWGRFEDSRRVLVTLADTPGLADTEGDDEKNIPILKEYIKSVGKRIGVTAFLLVFKIDSGVDMILTILTTFDDIMKEFPDFWDNVVLVFTGCDFRRNVMNTKELYYTEIQRQLEERFFKGRYNQSGGANSGSTGAGDRSPMSQESSSTNGPTSPMSPQSDDNSGSPIVPMVFLTSAEAPCGFALGEKCDCKARTTFLNAGLKRLWYAVKSKKRWVLEEDEDEDGLLGHS